MDTLVDFGFHVCEKLFAFQFVLATGLITTWFVLSVVIHVCHNPKLVPRRVWPFCTYNIYFEILANFELDGNFSQIPCALLEHYE